MKVNLTFAIYGAFPFDVSHEVHQCKHDKTDVSLCIDPSEIETIVNAKSMYRMIQFDIFRENKP